ncbi:hypothetical protein [Pseudomonas sp. Root329]|uniref:hypothetical protein n=1 Tax=Pseudomonas sp. Root329 TaxID=1736515 RepID=UPI000ABAED15|nr:hypothetical protein [Pseudomonas sp. Root329]
MDGQRTSRRFIALAEVLNDESDPDGQWVTFDGIAEDVINRYRYPDDWQIGEFRDSGLLTLRAPLNEVMRRFSTIERIDGRWVCVEVTASGDQDLLQAGVILFGDNAEFPQVGIMSIEFLEPRLCSRLDRLSMLLDEQRAYSGFIAAVLDASLRGSHGLAVAAYDVGQGNCNAIIDSFEHPRIFFDLGWAPNFHASTRPVSAPNLFSCHMHSTSPVVLSHWDMDHWSYAIERSAFNSHNLTTSHEWRQDALSRFWIARAPEAAAHKLGPLTMAFCAALGRTHLFHGFKALLLWPANTKRIRFAAGWVEACKPGKGLPDDRNNSGLALFVRPNVRGAAVVLTGDADFLSIPSLAGKKVPPLAGLVAPHHGSYVTTSAVPAPKKGTPARVVMSVGKGNTYGHPKQAAIDAYALQGWDVTLTQDRHDCTHCHATHRNGNSLLKFTIKSSDPRCSCCCVGEGHLCLVPSSRLAPIAVAGVKKSRKSAKTVASI